ncbi:MAG: hypothetical protein RLY31_2983 [Bacteroidota bacterium]
MKLLYRAGRSVFVFVWIVFLLIDYFQKHPEYALAVAHFSYVGYLIFLVAVGGGLTWLARTSVRKQRIKWLNGSLCYLVFLFGALSSLSASHRTLIGSPLTGDQFLHAVFFLLATSLALFLTTVAAFTAGSLLMTGMGWKERQRYPYPLVAVAAGCMVLVAILFALGTFRLLVPYLLIPVFTALFVMGRTHALPFARTLLLEPLATVQKGVSEVGPFAFAGTYFLLVLLGMNFAAIHTSMPTGFDALTLYANLPKLIAERHGLVEGFQPYNWSLLQSVGITVFQSVPVMLALSWLGGTFALAALYGLSRHSLGLSVQYSIGLLLTFSLTPAFYLQSYGELKIDLALLFLYLVILSLLVTGWKETETPNPPLTSTGRFRTFLQHNKSVILTGLLMGFSLGTKLTTIYFMLAVCCAIWYRYLGWRGMLSILSMSIGGLLLFRLDAVAGLREYHLGVGPFQWGFIAAGTVLLIGTATEQWTKFLATTRRTILLLACMLLPFLPWMVKNQFETGSWSPQMLLNGKQVRPEIRLVLPNE